MSKPSEPLRGDAAFRAAKKEIADRNEAAYARGREERATRHASWVARRREEERQTNIDLRRQTGR